MRFLRAAGSVSVAVVLCVAVIGMSPAIASADPCSVSTDQCQVNNTVQTPAGLVSVTVGPGHVVTVRLTPVKPNTLVRGYAGDVPAPPPNRLGYSRATFDTGGAGIVVIDTVVSPPGSPTRVSVPNVALISIHPPSPCRAQTAGNTVVFTPIG
jgi:hypothetical protein